MKFVRAIPQLGALPELLAFYCSRCKQADTKMQDPCLDRPGGCSLPLRPWSPRRRKKRGDIGSAITSEIVGCTLPVSKETQVNRAGALRRALIKLYRSFRWNFRRPVVIFAYIL